MPPPPEERPVKRSVRVLRETLVRDTDELDEKLDEAQSSEVLAALQALAKAHASAKNSWGRAGSVVNEFRPVASYLWRIVHSVLGRAGKTGNPDPIMFDAMKPLIVIAANDPSLVSKPAEDPNSLDQIVKALGFDTAAAICVMHGVCRRVSSTLVERIWRPIIDDALLRANIGFVLGGKCKQFGPGRGMLAGFCGRAGLAVQIASSDLNKAQRALEGLAAGMDIRIVGLQIYGCDPLQVSAMMLASAGVSTDAALGVAAFSENGRGVQPKTMQHLWLSSFAIIEHLRSASGNKIDPRYWKALALTEDEREEVEAAGKLLVRKGHTWGWLCESHLSD